MRANLFEYQEKMKKLINTLGSEIVCAMPDEWKTVIAAYFVAGNFDSEHVKLCVNTAQQETYRDLTEESWLTDEYDDLILEIQELFRQLRKISIDMGDIWYGATLTLRSNNSFSIDFKYEPIEEFNSDFLTVWENAYLI